MTIWDDRILEYIQEEESGSPAELEDSGYIRVSKSQISRRLRRLAEYGMLQHLGNGVYVITQRGEDYLAGDLDADDIEDPNGNGEKAQS
ncbi:ArsR family transcriptional regulator [Halobacterium rubrum]|uniref:ArsR family transcriptional regulator n=1 Tax=Halobacterium sp. TGN-42-S1 TaxID=2902625 RepID=UPI001F273427|nr:ArsR family transcriptional regulator [Halobacterium sp. TGN-42-S1]